ncbi:MAG: DUF4405 domain-containing protein [Proteobacteria bacterium]|uniref:DUF4405 domain-containing protein n=1 Tax=Candidatus Avisuccinivibrio stercorigallinarum TaxID=2840704 RepID=A0A9D9DCE4_9GAMM|nr:DUF4405 domain-containing protein [Candidatus Avisuccinivibrio stercorigallinarum]
MALSTKLVLDGALIVLLPPCLAWHLTGNLMHEWLGLAFVLVVLWHLWLNRRWFTALLRGRYNLLRRVNLLLTALLLTAFAGTLVSGVMLSRQVFDFLDLPLVPGMNRVHMAAVSLLQLTAALHFGLHFDGLCQRLRAKRQQGRVPGRAQKPRRAADNAQRPLLRAGLFMLLLGWAVFGLYQAGERMIFDKLFFQLEYPVFDFYESFAWSAFCQISLMQPFALTGVLLRRALTGRAQKSPVKKPGRAQC